MTAGHPYPHAFLLRGGNLVADPLASDLSLKLGKGQENVKREAPHRRRGVELLNDRDEGDIPLILDLDDLGEVR